MSVKKIWLQTTLGVLLSGMFLYAELPASSSAPSGEEYTAKELYETIKTDGSLDGKIVEVTFVGICYLRGKGDGVYEGALVSPETSRVRYPVYFKKEGLPFFQQYASADFNSMTKEEEVYVLISERRQVVLGDKFSKKKGYYWSKKSKPIDLDKDRTWSVGELELYGENLLGKIIEVEFKTKTKADNIDTNCFCTRLFSNSGDLGIFTFYPLEGSSFFDEVGVLDFTISREYTVYGKLGKLTDRELTPVQQKTLGVNPQGWHLKLEAVGRRRRGKGECAKYEW